ncbi:AAA family ATPase [Synechococcus sp. PCC 7336]|uniref:AAA family ATPase n=1 Tax=Synechococcus sp. PCC 7336 TaxID=195250 RepID=UPI00034922F8|nr:AAA family ATPase [Synechococcus sp. PCC 7336]
MLTRLKISGFKNLVDVDVRFGTFTCIAGANGVGKSNLFDSIRFLSALADLPLIEAALSIRDEAGKTGDVRSLFHRVGDAYADKMSFEAEMIVSEEGEDDLGQKAKASITFLRYSLILAYKSDNNFRSFGFLEILKEELVHINIGDATKNLLFPNRPTWRKSAVKGRRTSPFISTEDDGINRVIKLHQDGGSRGQPLSRSAVNLPRTVLSVTNAAEGPTALLARREMQSWRLLQLEPSSLRQPDEFTAPTKLEIDGSHLAATLYHLARLKRYGEEQSTNEVDSSVYYEIANRLASLIDDVDKVWIDRDDRRELLTLMVKSRDGTSHPAKALSDGTMRFLALAVLEQDPEAKGLLCLEEPENGIHPERIPKILHLLQDIATDTDEAIGPDNPLRQVIVNTHSPAVVMQVPEDSLLVAELREAIQLDRRFKRVCFGYLPNTWRHRKDSEPDSDRVVSKGRLLAYLNPVPSQDLELDRNGYNTKYKKSRTEKSKTRRVVDREDLQLLLPGFSSKQQL